jgi:inhibitor of cysteine peptidase
MLHAIMEVMTVVKIRLLVTVAMLVSSMLVGCTFQFRNPPTSKTLQVSMEDVLGQSVVTQNVTLPVGNTLRLKLGSNYSTPYRWTADTKIGDETIVKQTTHEFVQPTNDALGAPGTEVWTFTALKPGITTITTHYTSFVGHDSTPKCTYNATVTVQ